MIRKLAVFIAGLLFSFWLLTAVAVTALVLAMTPDNIKNWLDDGNVYNTIVDDLIAQSKTLNKPSDGVHTNPLEDPGVLKVARQTFNPNFLKTNVEMVIDGTTPWLEGSAAKPVFALDLAAAKTQFADNIGQYALDRYNGLPSCAPGQTPKSTDILTIDCQPSGFDANGEIQRAVGELKSSPDFLGKTVITAEDIGRAKEPGGELGPPAYQRADWLPKAYKYSRFAPYVLGAIALISALIIIFGSTIKRQGLKRVTLTLYLTAGVLLLQIFLVKKGFAKLNDNLASRGDADIGLQRTLVALLDQAQQAINQYVLYFTEGLLILAVLITLGLLLTRFKTVKKTEVLQPTVDDEARRAAAEAEIANFTNGPEAAKPTAESTDKPEPTTAPKLKAPELKSLKSHKPHRRIIK